VSTVNHNSTLLELIYALIYGGQSGVTVEERTTKARDQKTFIAGVEEKCGTLMIKQMDILSKLPTEVDKRGESAILGCFRRTGGSFQSQLINSNPGQTFDYFGGDIEINKRVSSFILATGLSIGHLKDVDFNQRTRRKRKFVDPTAEESV